MELTIVNMIILLTGLAYHIQPSHAKYIMESEESGAVAGRFVSISAKLYNSTFISPIKLGQCPLIMKEGHIQTCKDEFEGEIIHLAKGKMTVDVTRVQSAEDILLHTMGGVGAGIGILGLVSVNPKVKVAVTTDTRKNSLNFISSYEINKGVMALHHPRPKYVEGDKALFLSEIELGGSELLLVTLGFESENKKVEVEVSVTMQIVFWSITAKLQYINKSFSSKASCRVQFKSSWREDVDKYFSDLKDCIPFVEEIEGKYIKGPQELRDMSPEDERSHYFYYFSSWKASPYGSKFNLALINHDLESLTEQNTEIKAVIENINKLKDQRLSDGAKEKMFKLNETLTHMTQKITTGLNEYHMLKEEERENLRKVYGVNKAPQYYKRYLEKIVS